MTEPGEAAHAEGEDRGGAAVEGGAPVAPPAAPGGPGPDAGTGEEPTETSGSRAESRGDRVHRRRAGSAAGGRVRKKKAPGGPTRPQGAYMQFLAHYRVQYAEELKGMQAADIGRRAGAAWRALSDEEKLTFKERADMDKMRYAMEKDITEGQEKGGSPGGSGPAKRCKTRPGAAASPAPPSPEALSGASALRTALEAQMEAALRAQGVATGDESTKRFLTAAAEVKLEQMAAQVVAAGAAAARAAAAPAGVAAPALPQAGLPGGAAAWAPPQLPPLPPLVRVASGSVSAALPAPVPALPPSLAAPAPPFPAPTAAAAAAFQVAPATTSTIIIVSGPAPMPVALPDPIPPLPPLPRGPPAAAVPAAAAEALAPPGASFAAQIQARMAAELSTLHEIAVAPVAAPVAPAALGLAPLPPGAQLLPGPAAGALPGGFLPLPPLPPLAIPPVAAPPPPQQQQIPPAALAALHAQAAAAQAAAEAHMAAALGLPVDTHQEDQQAEEDDRRVVEAAEAAVAAMQPGTGTAAAAAAAAAAQFRQSLDLQETLQSLLGEDGLLGLLDSVVGSPAGGSGAAGAGSGLACVQPAAFQLVVPPLSPLSPFSALAPLSPASIAAAAAAAAAPAAGDGGSAAAAAAAANPRPFGSFQDFHPLLPPSPDASPLMPASPSDAFFLPGSPVGGLPPAAQGLQAAAFKGVPLPPPPHALGPLPAELQALPGAASPAPALSGQASSGSAKKAKRARPRNTNTK